MLAAGMLIIWFGWDVSLWGWCLLRGYNVTLGQLSSPVHPYGSGKGQVWPPPLIPDSQIFPGGAAAAAGGKNPLAGGIVSPATARKIAQTVTGQFRSHPPTPSGNPSAAQQLTGGT